MTRLPVPSLLATIDLFAGLPENVRRDISERGDTLTFRPGRAVVEQGLPGAGLCLVLEGSADVGGRAAGRLAVRGRLPREIAAGRRAPFGRCAPREGLAGLEVSAPAFAPVMERVARVLLAALWCGCAGPRPRSPRPPAG
jgi:hypothetical protein